MAGGDKVRAGIGDDCAVLRIPSGHEALITTDFSLEGIHFRREWHPPTSVGHRCLTRGLSDIAATGGEPIAAFLSLAVPARLPQQWIDEFMRGFLNLARRFDVVLAGGDTAESPAGILADIVVMGSAPSGTAILRSSARAGDGIYVTGALGGSTAALGLLMKGRKKQAQAYERHFYPIPRIEVGLYLREHELASSMIDLSDGLSTDLAHICEESGVGAEVDATLLPLASAGKERAEVDLEQALHGGEDYELLFTARKRDIPSHIAGAPVTRIGEITQGTRAYLRTGKTRRRLPIRGWEHFSRK